MALMEILRSQEDRELLTHDRAADFLHGCVSIEAEGAGWIRPQRFLPLQLRTLESCMAWHPGLFRQMAQATSGVCLRLRTDATEIALAVRIDPQPRGTKAQLRVVEGREPRSAHDGISCDVDGRHLPVATPQVLESGLAGLPELRGAGVVTFRLDLPGEAPEPGLQVLPGFGPLREVTLWLPCLSGCVVRDLWTDGLTVEPLPPRPELLVLGDSIAQGFVTDDPGLTWPALLAKRLDFDLLDQGIGGQVFQMGTTVGLGGRPAPERIVVEFGTNYRFEACSDVRTQREAAGYLAEVARMWPDVPTQVLTPLWHDEAASPTHPHSCFGHVPAIIRVAAAPHGQMQVVDGARLVDHRRELFADPDHPNADGAAVLASRCFVALRLQGLTPGELADRARKVLEAAPRQALPMREVLAHGRGEVLFAEEGCVLVRVRDGNQMLFAPDHELGRAAVGLLLEPTLVTVCGQGFERDVRDVLGLDLVTPCHLVVYEGERPLPVDGGKASAIRVLDVSYADAIRERYDHAEFLRPGQVEALLARGVFLGAFEDGELVGFVGEHEEGSIGMLEVLPGHRRKGWGRALESAKVNQVLARGDLPWMQVLPQSKASLKLQEALGMRVCPASDQCFVSRRAR